MKKILLVLVCIIAAGALVASALTPEEIAARQAIKDAELAANPPGAGFTGTIQPRNLGAPEATPGTLIYDTGVLSGVGSIPAIADNFSFGNQFNVNNGGGTIPLPITVTAASYFPAIINSATTGTGAAFCTVFGPLNVTGTNAPPLDSPSVGLTIGTWNAVSFSSATITGTGAGSFLVGMWNPTAGNTGGTTPCGNDCVGVDTNDGGLGFHGMAIEDLNGGNFTPMPAWNALIRPSGNVVPVELMNFSIK